jgi:hypothetical protein
MTYSVAFQEWITVSGNNNVVTQSEEGWAEIDDFHGMDIWLEFAGATNASVTFVDIQSSPTKDEAFFSASQSGNAYLMRWSFNSATAVGPYGAVVNWATVANQVPGAYLRWKLTFPTGATTITFRIWLCLRFAGWGGTYPAAAAVPQAKVPVATPGGARTAPKRGVAAVGGMVPAASEQWLSSLIGR